MFHFFAIQWAINAYLLNTSRLVVEQQITEARLRMGERLDTERVVCAYCGRPGPGGACLGCGAVHRRRTT